MQITNLLFSTINNKWYLRIDDLEIEISEINAKRLIEKFNLIEYNLNRWKTNSEN